MAKQFKLRDERQLPPPEQMGAMQDRYVTHVETGTITKTHVAVRGPIERWKRAGRLSDSQLAAVKLCEDLWDKVGLKQKVTQNWGERIYGGCDNQWLENTRIDMQSRLDRIEGYVSPDMWETWENVVRFGEDSGTVGAALGFKGSKATMAAVLTVVRCVADIIAREERL